MIERFGTSSAGRRLLPEGRLAGPMPWVLAIMTFLTVLAMAAGLGLYGSARALERDMAGRVVVQIVEPDAALRDTQRRALARTLARLPGVRAVDAVSDAEMEALLAPWFGAGGIDRELPVPALIDVTLDESSPAAVDALRRAALRITPKARIDRHAAWLAPLGGLLSALVWLAAGLILLMAISMAAVVALASRAALNTYRETIDVMHMMGATDRQVAGLFQQRTALDAAWASVLGLAAGLLVVLLLGFQLDRAGIGLVPAGGFGLWHYAALLLAPLFVVFLSVIAARLTVLRALRKMV